MNTVHARVVSLIEQVGRLIKGRICDFNADEYKLTFNQIRLLDTLAQEGQMAMADIAGALRITPASATSLVNRMVNAGWLFRSGDPKDRRKVWIAIQEDRKQQFLHRQEQHRQEMLKLTGVLDEKQLAQLATILQTLVDRNS